MFKAREWVGLRNPNDIIQMNKIGRQLTIMKIHLFFSYSLTPTPQAAHRALRRNCINSGQTHCAHAGVTSQIIVGTSY